MKKILFFSLSLLFSQLIFADPNIGGVKMGASTEELIKNLHPKFECKLNEAGSTKETCRISYCNNMEDKKCNLWGHSALGIVRVYAALENKQLYKMIVDLDYLNMRPDQAIKVLEGIDKNVGASTTCPLKDFIKDQKATNPNIHCEWKSKADTLSLYVDEGRMKLKLEKNN